MNEVRPARGDIWWVRLDPTVGSDIAKTRPAVVVSTDDFAHVPVRVVVPLTTWQGRFERQRNKLFVARTDGNGLASDSAADVLQVRSTSLIRFDRKVGTLAAAELELLTTALHRATSAGSVS